MSDFDVIKRVRQIYEENGNIMEYLRDSFGRNHNTVEDVLISYDFQAGSYNEVYFENPKEYEKVRQEIGRKINQYINKFISLGGKDSSQYTILEAGVGEGTSLGTIWRDLEKKPECVYGFDISWSRVKECGKFLEAMGIDRRFLFVGDMFAIPMRDNSIDVVYTVHALEPNGGNESRLLEELYRVARRYLILVEPSYEFANDEQRKRMDHHGYVKNLKQEAEKLGYHVKEHQLLKEQFDNMNPAAFLIIDKRAGMRENPIADPIADPVSKGELIKGVSSYFSRECLVAYPIVENIPCLRMENAILATKYL